MLKVIRFTKCIEHKIITINFEKHLGATKCKE